MPDDETNHASPKGTPTQQRGMRNAIATQAFGCVSCQAFTNGILLVYLTALNISSVRTVVLLSIYTLGDALTRLPNAVLADRYGKKKVGLVGVTVQCVGFTIIAVAGSLPQAWRQWGVLVGILCFTFGISLMAAGWFALLCPVVPENLRGRFFGTLRFVWQSCAIAFTAVCACFLTGDSPVTVHQTVLGLIAALLAVRIVFYARIPELERPAERPDAVKDAMDKIFHADGFMSFCAYVFLISIFTQGCPTIFGLIEKRTLGLGDNVVVWLGNATMVGAVLGFFLSGRAVDKFGTKPVFLACHFGYGAVLFAYLLRGLIPGALVPVIGLLHLLFGLFFAFGSVAVSTELLTLIPPDNKSLSTSVCRMLIQAGTALSGLVCAWSLKLGVLRDSWQLLGRSMSAYDTILLAYGSMVLVLIVTLGLVPSVLGKPQFTPHT